MNLEAEKEVIDQLRGRLAFLEESIVEDEAALKESKAKLAAAKDAQELLQLVSKAVQQMAHSKISQVVTSCLEAVFGENAYTFKIQFEAKRGKTEARLCFMRGDMEVDPLTASGGGVVDVAAFALRATCLVLHRPRLSPVLVLDEPFRFVSEEYQDNVRVMLEDMAEDLGIQIVMVTHNERYETGKVIRL